MTAGTTFTHEGERYVISLYGPKTCLCYLLESGDITLWRFETHEIARLIDGRP